MAIIYSYEQEANPHFSDLLLGTDVSAVGKPTKSFSIQSIVDLVQSVIPGGGTVTSVATNDTSFISMGGGPILTSGTLTASLSATGVPSVNTFLRGDNTWSTIPASPNTLYTLSSSLAGANININLDGTDSTKTVVSLAAGPNISLTDNGSNRITIGVTNLPAGTVTSVTTGKGLEIQSGTATKDPKLAIDITGSNNYIKISEDQTTAFAEDIIAFNQNSSTNVKTTKLGEITPTSLTLIKNYIDAGDAGDITNTTDNYETTASVKNVVTLTSAEYTALTQKDANTMYIIAGAQPTYTTTLAFTNNIVGTEYTIIGDQAGLQKTGPVNSSYAYNTTVSPNEGYYFSVPASITNASGLFTADETVNTILSGTVSAIADPGVTATLALQIAPSMGVEGVEYTLDGNVSGNTVTGSSPLDYSFDTIVNVTPGYTAITPVVVNNASSARDGQLNANGTVITYITGAIEKDPGAEVTVAADIIENFTGAYPNEATVVVTPLSFGGDSPVSYDFNVSVVANEGYYFVEPPVITGDLTGTSEVTRDAVINVSGQIEKVSNTAIVNLEITNTIDGPSNGYTVTTVPSSLQLIGEVPFAYNFNTTVTLNEGFEWVSGVPPTINNAAGTTNVIGEQTVTTTISNAQVAETTQLVEATLNVDYVITGDAVWSPAGDLTGTIQSGLPPFQYNWNNTTEFPNRKPTIVIDQPGYGFSVPPYAVPSSIADQIVEDTTVNVTVYAAVEPIVETGSVTLDVQNNITPSGTTSVTVTKYLNGILDESEGNTIEGAVGETYSFVTTAVAIAPSEISNGPFYSEGNPVSGVISSGNITRTQIITGETTTPATDTVVSATGRTWKAMNEGATRVALSMEDDQARGSYYQWGRLSDGHELKNSLVSTETSSSDDPQSSNFFLNNFSPYDWRVPQNSNLWQGVDGVNNPGLDGFRLPTQAEWEEEIATWSSPDAEGAFNSALKLPLNGYRQAYNGGPYINTNMYGFYWSSDVDTTTLSFERSIAAYWANPSFSSIPADLGQWSRAIGMGVRLIKDENYD
jgi:hypothetical protein